MDAIGGSMEKSQHVNVFVFAKGFEITKNHREFQLIVPNIVPNHLSELENYILNILDWPNVIDSFFESNRNEKDSDYFLIKNEAQGAIVCISPSLDHLKRKSVIVIASFFPIDLVITDPDLPLAKIQNLGFRLLEEFGSTFIKNREIVERQLSKGSFLSTTIYSYSSEQIKNVKVWNSITEAIRNYKGIIGIAPTFAIKYCGNVLLGSKDDSMNPNFANKIDGYISPITNEFTIIRNNIEAVEKSDLSFEGDVDQLRREIVELKSMFQSHIDSLPSLLKFAFDEALSLIIGKKKKK
ncbi:hypothetical protein [Leptospira santarosai]|nr:hypothetical protein [Leptospira santarosai]